VTNWILRWVVSGIALAVVAHLNIGVSYKDVTSLAIATVVIGLVNSLIRPVIGFLTLPLNCMTFGLFGVVVNAILFWAAGNAVPGFHVEWPWGPVLGPILMGLLSGLLSNIIPDRKKD
jgi:putative membrane protein